MNFHPQISNQDGGNSIKERRHGGRCITNYYQKHIFAQCQICIRSQVCKCQTKATILSTIAMMELESLLRKRSLSRGLHTGDFLPLSALSTLPGFNWHHLACHNHVFLTNRCGVSDEELERKKKVYLDHLKQDSNLGFSVIIHQ